MTYGEHQEAVSGALVRLLTQPDGDSDRGATRDTVAAQYRRQSVLAVQERLFHLGTTAGRVRHVRTDRVVDAARYPLHVLGEAVDHLRRVNHVSEAAQLPPSVLFADSAAPGANIGDSPWRLIARHLLLGNADLAMADDQPWQHHERPAWYLVGDAARTIEALIALSQPSSEDARSGSRGAWMAHRLAAGTVARVADWYGTDATPDLAFAAPAATLGRTGGPRIEMIRRPEDYVAAQRALAGFVRQRGGGAGAPGDGPDPERPGLLAARAIATGQVRLAGAFARWADATPGGGELAGQFRGRIARYQALHRATVRLTELHPASSPLVVTQQSEMVQQLRRFTAVRVALPTLVDLNAASHDVAVETGRALRREGMRLKNILILDTSGLGPPGGRPITNTGEPFNLACRALANDPPPPPPDTMPTRASREALTASIAVHRTRHPPAVRRAPAP